jgi:hypothetical protein
MVQNSIFYYKVNFFNALDVGKNPHVVNAYKKIFKKQGSPMKHEMNMLYST